MYRIAVAFAFTLFVCSGQLSADLLFSENFDSLSLQGAVDETGTGFDKDAWTPTPPAGWNSDPRTTPPGGVTEWFGWTFANPEFWVAADDQRRSEFSLGQNVIAVADPDEYDDGATDIDPDKYTTVLTTPDIDVSNVVAGSLVLNFDSSWRDEDVQGAIVNAIFDGGDVVNVLTWSSDSSSPNFKDDTPNESLSFAIDNPAGASIVAFEFDMPQAGNDWWWAIDNVAVEGELIPEPASGVLLITSLLGLLALRRRP